MRAHMPYKRSELPHVIPVAMGRQRQDEFPIAFSKRCNELRK
jgi:hypothetical protein